MVQDICNAVFQCRKEHWQSEYRHKDIRCKT